MGYRWWPQAELEQAVDSEPEQFTAWFPQVLARTLVR
jgi:isopentenyl-diphosphate delta-isomerase